MKLTKYDKKAVGDTTHMKLVENKTHFGPVSEDKVAKAKAAQLSAAANKVRLMADFTVKISKDPTEETESRSNARSLLFIEIGSSPLEIAESAVYIMQAWDIKYGDEGTPDYTKKLSAALAARAEAYRTLGINPSSGTKPNLSADQRLVYNSIVGPTGFDYYEYHLAFKIDGQKKFARSKTYRSLRPLDISRMLSNLSIEANRLKNDIDLRSRQNN
jgi:acetyl-CoA acetyltransferase